MLAGREEGCRKEVLMRTHKVLAARRLPFWPWVSLSLSSGQADDEKDLKAARHLEKLVKTATDKPEDLQKAGEDFAKANRVENDNIKDVMDFLNKHGDVNDKKGVGWGVGKLGAIKSDGIELKLHELAKGKKMSKAQLEKEQDALVEMANRIAAVGAVSLASPPKKGTPGKKGVPGKGPMEWKMWSEEMVESSREFAKAVKSNDPEVVRKAAAKLDGTCSDCHR